MTTVIITGRGRLSLGAAVAVLFFGSALGQEGGFRTAAQEHARRLRLEQEQYHRNAILYSERSTIVPDPDMNPVSEEVAKELATKYGRWHFWDGEESERPEDANLCDKFPSCDFEGDEIDDTAWQADAVYVNHILNDADELVTRAMEAIFEEYGHPKPSTAEGLSARMKMFHWEKIDLSTAEGPPEQFKGKKPRGNGGWTTQRSHDGLVRRLLHAMMTTSTFTVVLAGHSAAAGHGNHFRQSYIMQFHKVMAPIFARLGIKLITRNISQGGMGTLQNSMASGSLYGEEIDLLLWDAGMTEKGSPNHIDLFFRQGLIGGKRVPVIWSAGGQFSILKKLHEECDADVGEFGRGSFGIEPTTSEEQAETLPWAVQYMKCSDDAKDVCKKHPLYCAKCWVDREDGIRPEEPQNEHFGGQVSWHPGWRQHQLQGRVIAFSLLEALQQAVQLFSDGTMGGPPLADEEWHVNDYYNNIREKVKNTKMDPEVARCFQGEGLPKRVCTTPMRAVSQYTPRANFNVTSLASIVKPAADGYVPKNNKVALYEGRNAHNECFDIPEGQIDVLAIVAGRRRNLQQEVPLNFTKPTTNVRRTTSVKRRTKTKATSETYVPARRLSQPSPEQEQQQHRNLDEIKPGRGWELVGEPQGYCDGTYDAVCSRDTHHKCVLAGHHDSRAAVVGNALSGWLVMSLPAVEAGIIMVKVHTWATENTITADWKTENNERRLNLGAVDHEDDYDDSDPNHRLLDKDPAEDYPDTFKFEYAINGAVTTLDKQQFIEKRKKVQRVVEIITLLDDENFTTEAKDVEIAVRLQGCGRECTLGVSHVYWA